MKYYSKEKSGKNNNLCFEINSEILKSYSLSEYDLKAISLYLRNIRFFRFESLGELSSETHLINYVRIAEATPGTSFCLFTKQYYLVYKYLKKGFKLPDNLNLVLSAYEVNKPFGAMWIYHYIKEKHPNTIIFEVYTSKFAAQNNLVINCEKNCLHCLNCYKMKGEGMVNVKEVLK
jgi:hypothetical protein